MKRLTAQRPILYGGRMYQAGDTLPAYDKRMVQAWLSAESAKMTDDAAEEATMPRRTLTAARTAPRTPTPPRAPRR